MAQGILDFAEFNQLMVITPFCLMGAMVRFTIVGALVLSHAEALAGLTLSQLKNPGYLFCYGSFTSNVDLKSGAPAFGIPEQFQANLGVGQLARKIGIPWRSAAGCAANINDAQAANETQMSLWSCLLSGCTTLVHNTSWIEGGLTVSYKKLIADLEVIQIIAELCNSPSKEKGNLDWNAILDVQPGGIFLAVNIHCRATNPLFMNPLIRIGLILARGQNEDLRMLVKGIWSYGNKLLLILYLQKVMPKIRTH